MNVLACLAPSGKLFHNVAAHLSNIDFHKWKLSNCGYKRIFKLTCNALAANVVDHIKCSLILFFLQVTSKPSAYISNALKPTEMFMEEHGQTLSDARKRDWVTTIFSTLTKV